MTVKLPFIKWRDGRPRLVHGPRERAQGFLDRDLRHEGSGAWFTFEEAKAFSETHLAEIHKARQSKKIKVRDEPPARPLTIEDLLNDWFNSREVQSLAPASISSYAKAMRAVLYRRESREEAKARRRQGILETAREREAIATVTPSAVGAPELRAFFNHLRQVRGHTMALAAIATLSAAFTRGRESTKWRLGVNPRLDMQFDRPDGRVVLITLPEFLAVVAAGDAAGRRRSETRNISACSPASVSSTGSR